MAKAIDCSAQHVFPRPLVASTTAWDVSANFLFATSILKINLSYQMNLTQLSISIGIPILD